MSATTDTLAQTSADVDPTRTKTLRRRYAQRLRGGFAAINTEVRRGVRERDIFGINLDTDILADSPPSFRFKTDDAKIEGFREWLDRQQRRDVLSIVDADENTFIRSAYGSGLRQADAKLRQARIDAPDTPVQTSFNLPPHKETLQRLYTRNFQALEGITDEVGRQVSRELADGFAQGENPRKIAERITDRIDTIGKTRATTMARTEVINAHSEATLNRFEETGVEEITAKAEFTTAGDRRVCPQCASLEGQVFTTQEARGVIPVHPSCRCAWRPRTGSNT